MSAEDPLDQTTIEPQRAQLAKEEASAIALTIVGAPDMERIGQRCVLQPDEICELSRKAPLFGSTPLSDPHVSRSPLELRLSGGVLHVGTSSKATLGGEPLSAPRELPMEALKHGVVLVLAERVVLLLHEIFPLLRAGQGAGLIGQSAAMTRVRQHIERVAKHDVSALVCGESGSGKELVARAIHDLSERRDQPYVAVNMAAIPATTASSALFGHTKGAFTGASEARGGFFEAAHGGTLFLDEVGDTPVDVQTLLLRTLETGEIQRVGSATMERVDVRVIAATDADLTGAVDEGSFRLALFQRLSGYRIDVPPLRERREDIALLLRYFLRRDLDAMGLGAKLDVDGPRAQPWLPAWLVARAVQAPWRGNVRELLHFARQLAIIWHDRDVIAPGAEIDRLLPSDDADPVPSDKPSESRRELDALSDEQVIEALRACDFSPSKAARALSVSRTTMFRLMKRIPEIRDLGDYAEGEIAQALRASSGDVKAAASALSLSVRALKMRMKQLGLDPVD